MSSLVKNFYNKLSMYVRLGKGVMLYWWSLKLQKILDKLAEKGLVEYQTMEVKDVRNFTLRYLKITFKKFKYFQRFKHADRNYTLHQLKKLVLNLPKLAGEYLLETSHGIIFHSEAVAKNVGGRVLFYCM